MEGVSEAGSSPLHPNFPRSSFGVDDPFYSSIWHCSPPVQCTYIREWLCENVTCLLQKSDLFSAAGRPTHFWKTCKRVACNAMSFNTWRNRQTKKKKTNKYNQNLMFPCSSDYFIGLPPKKNANSHHERWFFSSSPSLPYERLVVASSSSFCPLADAGWKWQIRWEQGGSLTANWHHPQKSRPKTYRVTKLCLVHKRQTS